MIVGRASKIICARRRESVLLLAAYQKPKSKTTLIPRGADGINCNKEHRSSKTVLTASRLEKPRDIQYVLGCMEYPSKHMLHVVGEAVHGCLSCLRKNSEYLTAISSIRGWTKNRSAGSRTHPLFSSRSPHKKPPVFPKRRRLHLDSQPWYGAIELQRNGLMG